jgi:DNA-directed RNA polymerase I subunit RPA2
VRTVNHNEYDFGLCPSGTNAVVAVISYTGYDMEDAMIINKGAYDRGFGHGCVYKSYIKEFNPEGTKSRYRIVNQDKGDRVQLDKHGLDTDGLPHVG